MSAPSIETTTTAVGYLRLIPLAPLVGVLLHVVFGGRLGRRGVALVACTAVAVSLAVSTVALLAVGQ